MKKIFSKILIGVVTLSIFLAPVSVIVKVNQYEVTLETTSSKIFAQTQTENWWFRWDYDTGQPGDIENFPTQGECEAARQARIDDGFDDVTNCVEGSDQTIDYVSGNTTSGYSFGCLEWNGKGLPGCFAAIFHIIWELSAKLMRLGGQFLDFFVYYSTNSSSYTASFVEKGWAVVRDIANLFFIIALIYVAIKTILDMGHSNSKKMVATIIVIALVINFSLFVTKVVIDGSNILAKIFYNNITPVDKNGQPLTAENGGEKSITVGMVDKFNPQTLVAEDIYDGDNGVSVFIFTTFILICITLYATYVFFAVGLLFVARVITLWMSMIFSPIAFASYTVPFEIPGFGHRKWWSDLFENAMLAPLFIFFLYLIVLFLNIRGDVISYNDNDPVFGIVMKVIIPFVILAALLMKAKELAVKYSGEMGGAVMSAGKMVGGLALGAAAGGVALVGSRVGGGLATRALAKNGEALRERANKGGIGGFMAKQQLKALNYGTKATFDARKTVAGDKLAGVSGMNFQSSKIIGLGSKEKGFAGAQERYQEKKIEESKLYKTTKSDEKLQEERDEAHRNYDQKAQDAVTAGRYESVDAYKADTANNPAPKTYNSAAELNAERMKEFTEQIGKGSLMINAFKTAGLAAIGGMIAGPAGVIPVVASAAGGGVLGGSKMFGDNEIQRITKENLGKQFEKEGKALGDVASRVEQLNTILEEGKKVLPDVFIKDSEGKPTNTVDSIELKAAVIENTIDVESYKNQFNKNPTTVLKDQYIAALTKKEMLSSLKTINKDLSDLTGKKTEKKAPTPPPSTT